ncbi:serine hydrolase [Tolypothrix bouteillei VB521301_2]|uniref:serine hydrolase n=1 Tax=Tolypothrix bouteillei TaxID=1246981 RepID=UPI0038B57007
MVLQALKSTNCFSQVLAWKDVVQLQPSEKSLPSGMLHTWPDGSYLTVQTLASLMISLSDNTATDITQLICLDERKLTRVTP